MLSISFPCLLVWTFMVCIHLQICFTLPYSLIHAFQIRFFFIHLCFILMWIDLPFHLLALLSVHHFTCPFIHSSIHPSIHPSIKTITLNNTSIYKQILILNLALLLIFNRYPYIIPSHPILYEERWRVKLN